MSKTGNVVSDDQTGTQFTIESEQWYDIVAACISIAYSLAVIPWLAWLLLDTWTGQYLAWPFALYKKQLSGLATEDAQIFRLVFYTAIGGGIGAAVNNIRSFVQWHSKRKGFGWRFVWKYISLPPLGATLAVMVYGIIRSGMAVFSGGLSGSGDGAYCPVLGMGYRSPGLVRIA